MKSWNAKDGEFKGYVKAKLEGIEKSIEDNTTEISYLSRSLRKVDVKVATIAGTVAIVVTIVGFVIQHFIFL